MNEPAPRYAFEAQPASGKGEPQRLRHVLELALEHLEKARAGTTEAPELDQVIKDLRAEIRRRLIAVQFSAETGYSFMPNDGYCYHCRADLLAGVHLGDKQEAVTGCRKCHRSFCE